jgi:uncharacterized Zn finger protein (UPF0148 family)
MDHSNMRAFKPQMSIYIPTVKVNTTEEQIKRVFKQLDLGVVSRVDFVEREKGHNMAFVHFDYWMINNSSYLLQERILFQGQGKVVFNDPYFWIVMENKNPRTQAEVELEKKVLSMQKRIAYLETVVATHTRKFIDNGLCTTGKTCSQCWTVSIEDSSICPACGYDTEVLVSEAVEAKSEELLREVQKEVDMSRETIKYDVEDNDVSRGTGNDVDAQGTAGWWPW